MGSYQSELRKYKDQVKKIFGYYEQKEGEQVQRPMNVNKISYPIGDKNSYGTTKIEEFSNNPETRTTKMTRERISSKNKVEKKRV